MRTTMISYEEFEDIVVNTLKRNISSNEDQKKLFHLMQMNLFS